MSQKSAGRPRSERAQNAILLSAFELLESSGVASVTVEAVAARANVGKPTIYRYWANAQELAMAAVMAKSKATKRAEHSESPLQELRSQLSDVVERFASPSGRQTAILMASADPESELSKAFRNQVILKSREHGRGILQRAINQEQVKPEIPIESVLDMIYGPIFYRLLTGHASLHNEFANEIIDTLFDDK